MARRLPDHPSLVEAVTLTTYPTTATNADDTITGTGLEALSTGTEIVLNLDGGDAHGLTDDGTYFVIENTTDKIKVATTYANAIAGTAVNVAGDAGAGDVFPVYDLNGAYVFIGTGGTLSVIGLKGMGENKGGVSTTAGTPDSDDAMVEHLNVANGTLWPWRIGRIHTYVSSGTCVSNVTKWY